MQALAEEVVSLEETVLRLRSKDIRQDKASEAAAAERRSAEQKLASAQADRARLQSTVEALQASFSSFAELASNVDLDSFGHGLVSSWYVGS